jgi:hypothetical protein
MLQQQRIQQHLRNIRDTMPDVYGDPQRRSIELRTRIDYDISASSNLG